jgi:glycerate 2-kinase
MIDVNDSLSLGILCLEDVAGLIQAILTNIDPYHAVANNINIEGAMLKIGQTKCDLEKYKKIYVLSVGKASIPMAKAVNDKLGRLIDCGLIIYKNISPQWGNDFPSTFRLIRGNHPVPGVESIQAGNSVISLLKKLTNEDLIIVLISGGGSSLMTAPVADIPLASIQDQTKKMLASGANIQEMNIIRKHMDQLKGGGLIKISSGAKIVSLIVSDVVGDDISSIASGPTTFDESTFRDAISIIGKYGLESSIDPKILVHFQKGTRDHFEETIKPGDIRLENVQNAIVLRNSDAIDAARRYALNQGWKDYSEKCVFTGEARIIGAQLGEKLKEIACHKPDSLQPEIFITGGETTVTLQGRGRGGRNLELALSAVNILEDVKNVVLVSLATDGEDGTTDAAGALVTGKTKKICQSKGLDPDIYLANNDSYTFFEKVGGLIKTGPTGTNVNDLVILIAY